MKNLKIEAIVLAVGLAILGVFLYCGLRSFSRQDRIVNVRGLAEREVKADHVIWPIMFKTSSNDMQDLYRQLNSANAIIKTWLQANGIPANEISVGAPQISDLKANQYSDLSDRDRFSLSCVTTVSTSQVDRVRSLIPRVGELLAKGVAISGDDDYSNQVQYDFTKLNAIKPQMIAEATKKAREAADKFAKDSDSKIGKIKSASQGLFEIDDRDQYTPYIKKVRVVTSLNFYIEN